MAVTYNPGPGPTTSDDLIDISGDESTTSIDALDGNDTITTVTGTLIQDLYGGAGNDVFNIVGTILSGTLGGGTGTNTFNITDSTIADFEDFIGQSIFNLSGTVDFSNNVSTLNFDDQFNVLAGATVNTQGLNFLGGSDTVSLAAGSTLNVTGNLDFHNGNDTFAYDGADPSQGTLNLTGTLLMGGGTDTLTLENVNWATNDINAAEFLTLNNVTLDQAFDVFHVTLDGNVTLNSMQFQNGAISPSFTVDPGANLDIGEISALRGLDLTGNGAETTIAGFVFDPTTGGNVSTGAFSADVERFLFGPAADNDITIRNTSLVQLDTNGNATGVGSSPNTINVTLENVTGIELINGGFGHQNIVVTGNTTFGSGATIQTYQGDDTVDLSGITGAGTGVSGLVVGMGQVGNPNTDNDTFVGSDFDDEVSAGVGTDSYTGGLGNDKFIYTAGQDLTITDFNTGSTNVGNGNQDDNDFIDLSAYYTNQAELLADVADGTLDQTGTGVDASDNTSMAGGSITGLTLLSGLTDDEIFDLTNVPVCFTTGTLIRTPTGARAVETLQPGDLVETMDGDMKPIRWIGCQSYSKAELAKQPALRPVRITAGAVAPGLPKRDLVVSRQHRLLVSSPIVKRVTGSDAALIAAIKLTKLPGIYVDETVESVDYYHFTLDGHDVVFAEDTPAESLFLGAEARKSISAEGLAELETIFPELMDKAFSPVAVVPIPCNRSQKEIVRRIGKNCKPLVPVDVPMQVQGVA